MRSTFAVRETASLGIMGAPRVPPLNPSESIVLSGDSWVGTYAPLNHPDKMRACMRANTRTYCSEFNLGRKEPTIKFLKVGYPYN